ncbi:hypothetical protein L596_007108 [Steinernema carpocapsae]|uniref:Uncharacterized protein n=1 Tax=Steinernema carpocapsae TaxID=34508 RepID=A0A4U5P8Y8_STECR|nr:hypothetical protein L596_007108 [Steinernema carpocapsae]
MIPALETTCFRTAFQMRRFPNFHLATKDRKEHQLIPTRSIPPPFVIYNRFPFFPRQTLKAGFHGSHEYSFRGRGRKPFPQCLGRS